MKPHIVGTFFSGVVKALEEVLENSYLKLTGVELSFLYDIVHTKAIFIHHIGFWVVRIASPISIVIALVFFHISEKQGHDISDLMTTYILFSVALFLEMYSALCLVASNWMIVLPSVRINMVYKNISNFIRRAKNHTFCGRSKERYWSGCIGQYSIIQSVIRSKNQGFNWFKKPWDFLFRGEDSAEVSDILEETMIYYIKLSTRGFRKNAIDQELVRKIRSSWITFTLDRCQVFEIKNAMEGKAFSDCVIVWHMATDMCYYASNNAPEDSEEGREREAIYRVSNYMMYLMMERSSMMPPGLAELKTVEMVEQLRSSDIVRTCHRQASISLYEDIMRPTTDLEYRLKLGLPNTVVSLVKGLKRIVDEQIQWFVIRDGWMEMLTYAAVHCSRTEHFRSLSRGGELLTHYWLLLANYGIMEEDKTKLEIL